MGSDLQPRYPALSKIIEIAHQIAVYDRRGASLVHEIMMAVAEAQISDRPQPIETAPRERTRILLLYCPKQGGWQTGEWYPEKNRWVSNMNMETLNPTHWAEVPSEPRKEV